MSSLIITKQTGNFFSLVLDGGNPIISEQNRLTTIGNFCNFKTANGANLILKQNILYSDITIVTGVSHVPTSINDLWISLLDAGFFDGLATTGGSSTIDKFTELLDTFSSYIGRDGQLLVVNESEQKIETISISLFSEDDRTKLDGIETGAEVNIQSNWNETDPLSDAFIQNKPDLGLGYTAEDVANKVSEITGYDVDLYPNEKATHDALDLKLNIADLPTNLTLYPTNVASDVSGYVKMVTDIHAPDYNVTAVDVSTPAITGTGQLVSQRIADAGVLIGQPGVFNFTTFGNIRRLSGSGTAEFYTQAYHRDSLGVETLVGTSSPSAVVVNGTYAEFTTSGVWDDGEFALTDRIVIKSYANRIAGGSDPVYQFQFGGATPVRTLLPVPFSVVDAGYELKANKSSVYTTDTEKYYSSTYINGVLPKNYSKVVYMNANTPALSTIFDTENPPVTNNNTLKNDTANLYIGANASTWVYKTGTGYETEIVSSATSNFNTFGTTVDAGNSKTSHITRSGAMTLTGPLNILNLKIATTPTTSTASYDILTRNSSTTALEKVSNTALGNWNYSLGLIYPKSLTDKVSIGMNNEGLGIPFSVKAFTGSNNISFFYDNVENLVAKITSSGLFASVLTSNSYISGTHLSLSGYNGGIDGPSAISQIKLLSDETWNIKGKLKYNIDYSASYDSRTLVDKGYADGKVSKSGNETINGEKTFVNNLFANSSLKILNSDADLYGDISLNLDRYLFKNKSGNLQFLTQNDGFVTYKSPTISGTFSNANLTANRTFTLPDTTGTIPIISQTITNGVTDKSPSEDAVHDALSGHVKNIVKDAVPSTSVTGTLSETILKSYLISANTFASSDLMNIPVFAVNKVGAVGTANIKIYINTTNSLSGAVQLFRYNMGNTLLRVGVDRHFRINGGNLMGLQFTSTTLLTDIGTSTAVESSTPITVSSDFYIITTATLSDVTDSISQSTFLMTN